MAFTYETKLGPPNYGKRKGTGLVILHTTESASTTMTGAKAIADLQTKGTLKGSYNKIICTDGVLTTVPDTDISGGVNPFSDYWKPASWLYNLAPAFKINDPNSYALELSFMGIKANYDSKGWPPQMIEAAAKIIIAEEKRIGSEVVVVNHGDFQTNRSDAGSIATDLVLKKYQELVKAVDDQMTILEITTYDPPRVVSIPPNTLNLSGWNVETSRAEKTYSWQNGSSFSADALVVVTQDPRKAPQGTFVRAINGVYAGLLVPYNQVIVEEAVDDCSDQIQKATESLTQRMNDLEDQVKVLTEQTKVLASLRSVLRKVLS